MTRPIEGEISEIIGSRRCVVCSSRKTRTYQVQGKKDTSYYFVCDNCDACLKGKLLRETPREFLKR